MSDEPRAVSPGLHQVPAHDEIGTLACHWVDLPSIGPVRVQGTVPTDRPQYEQALADLYRAVLKRMRKDTEMTDDGDRPRQPALTHFPGPGSVSESGPTSPTSKAGPMSDLETLRSIAADVGVVVSEPCKVELGGDLAWLRMYLRFRSWAGACHLVRQMFLKMGRARYWAIWQCEGAISPVARRGLTARAALRRMLNDETLEACGTRSAFQRRRR
jgi:hypothetical protein